MSDLEHYAHLRPQLMKDADALRAAFFYFSPPNVMPKLALGKLTLEGVGDGYALVSGDGTARVLPLGDARSYYGTVLQAIERYGSLALVSEAVAKHLAKPYKCSLQHHEYIYQTDIVRAHPGGQFGRLRTNLNRVRRSSSCELIDGDAPTDYLALNKEWYQHAAPRKFRTYDKVSIDWLLCNWSAVQAFCPDVRLLGVRDASTGRLISFTIASQLTEKAWTAYTTRYSVETDLKACNTYSFARISEFFDADHENDGTADSASLKEIKERYTDVTLPAYQLTRKVKK